MQHFLCAQHTTRLRRAANEGLVFDLRCRKSDLFVGGAGRALADEFRDGDVPTGVDKARVIENAMAACAHEVMAWMDGRAIGYAISANRTGPLTAAILEPPQECWKIERMGESSVREWAEVVYVPDDGIHKKDRVTPRRYSTILVRPGDLLD